MRKILALVLAITTVFALAVPAMANTGIYYTISVNNSPTFRCNDGNDSNGNKVEPNVSAFGITNSSNGNTTYSFRVVYVDGKRWQIDDPKGAVTCPACGRKDWIVDSNQAGSGNPPTGNPTFRHYPNTKQITVKVIYYFEIPKCTAACKYAAGPCDFDCQCVKPCKYDANFKSHDCTLDCFGATHDANCRVMNFKQCDPNKKCKCAKNYSKTFEETILIPITGDIFKHTAPKFWYGGVFVADRDRVINETITADKTYEFFYKGSGKCKCRCLEPVCTIECKPCTFKPTCYHKGIVCDNCKSGKDSNHNNCEFGNPTSASNYFCTACTKKVGAWKWDKKTDKYTWEPADKGANAWTPAAWTPESTKLVKTCECGCPKS